MKKKLIQIIFTLIIVLGGFYLVYYYYNSEDSNTTLTILEKEWIEKNKKNLHDLEIITNIPVLNYNGKGVFLDFIEDFEKVTNLNFNEIAYSKDKNLKAEYSIALSSGDNTKEILVYQDHYVLIGTGDSKYDNPSEIKNMTIGVMKGNLEKVSFYLNNASNIGFKEYQDINLLKHALDTKAVNLIAVPRLENLNIVLEGNYNIVYNISELKQNYVLKLGNEAKLNEILTKYFSKWNREKLKNSFNKHLVSDYFQLSKITDLEKSSLKSKSYIYGYINNYPYDYNNLNASGLNINVLQAFKEFAEVKIDIKQFKNYEDMYNSFNSNNIDFYYDSTSFTDYKLDVYKTIKPYHNKLAIVSSTNTKEVINSVNSLVNSNVMTVKNSYINNYLKSKNIKTIEYNNINDLIKNAKTNFIMAIDLDTYNYYVRNALVATKLDYQEDITSYPYTFRDISDNKVFSRFVNFYLSFINPKEFKNNIYKSIYVERNTNNIIITVFAALGGIIALLFLIFNLYKVLYTKVIKIKEDSNGSKLKYIDMLTSLKNRNYLNEHIDEWDNTEIYPKAIVIVDLNNLAFINDNYGHQEGDNVITEAANILIKTQMDNSDLIRTSGNEFLIYLIGYDEKDILSYVKKLNKEMKNISHDFGASLGYSMVLDASKNIDDAVNEATQDMRNNKNNMTNE